MKHILTLIAVMLFVLVAIGGPAMLAQDKSAPAVAAPAPIKPAIESVKLSKADGDQLAALAGALKDNEQAYRDAVAARDRANSLISQYEKFTSDYLAVYFRSLAVAGRKPEDCQPSADRKSIECKPAEKK